MDMKVKFTSGTAVGEAGSSEIAGIAEERGRGVSGIGEEAERVRWVRRVVQ